MTGIRMPISAFSVDSRITISIEPELAVALGSLVLKTDTDNTALLALAHKLRSITNASPKRDHDVSHEPH